MATIIELPPRKLLGQMTPQESDAAPPRLWVAGDVGLVRRAGRVSIVGSRQASAEGLELAEATARSLVALGFTVVSGLAKGIDTAAHQGALRAEGRTIAVLGTPVDRYYPQENRRLQEWIAEHHAVVSQFPPGRDAGRGAFPRRNKTMALISDATIVIEATETSGTRHQAWAAIKMGRPLFLAEAVANDRAVIWAQKALTYGAFVLSADRLPESFEDLPMRSSVGSFAF